MSTYDDKPWVSLWDDDLPHTNVPETRTILEMFGAGAGRDPDFPLVSYFGTTRTSGQIDEASDALAVALQARGVRAGDRVVLYLQNVPAFIVGMLAVWKTGGIVVPANPMWRQRELELVLADAAPAAIVLLEHLWHDVAKDALPGSSVHTVVTCSGLDDLDEDEPPTVLADVRRQPVPGALRYADVVASHRGEHPDTPVQRPEDVAMLCYTSGTTGPPKGAMISHQNVVFNSQTFRNWRRLTPDDVVLAVAPLFHITGLIAHVTVSLLVPMRIVLGYRFDVGAMLDLIERYRATFTVGAITVFIAMLNHPSFRERDISSLTKIISGGAPIPPAVVDDFERATGTYIYNGYGLTEVTSPSHQTPVGRRSPVDPASGALAIGVPVPETESRIVDDGGKPLPPGEYGEIVIRGPQVVAGYWNKPDETASTIRDGWLATGDIGFMDSFGWFYLVDRKKDQINAAGYKVWPREVEDVLYEHPDVREAAVVGVPDQYRGETVKAFVSLKEGAQVSTEQLIAFCRERLAAYKAPRVIALLDDLPKTVSGKILRRELRARE
jgi:long-chain acyl-CoA synthetase